MRLINRPRGVINVLIVVRRGEWYSEPENVSTLITTGRRASQIVGVVRFKQSGSQIQAKR